MVRIAFQKALKIFFVSFLVLGMGCLLFKLSFLGVFALIGQKESEIAAYDFVKVVYFYGKQHQIYSYLLSCVFLGLFFLVAINTSLMSYVFGFEEKEKEGGSTFPIYFLLLVSLCCLVLYWIDVAGTQSYFPYPSLYWLAFVAAIMTIGSLFKNRILALSQAREESDSGKSNHTSIWSIMMLGLIIFLSFSLAKIYLPISRGQQAFPNEFLNLPTLVKTDEGERLSTDILNSAKPLGIFIGTPSNIATGIRRPYLQLSAEDIGLRLEKEFPEALYFDPFSRVLVSRAAITEAITSRLKQELKLPTEDLEKFSLATEAREEIKKGEFTESETQQILQYSPWLLQQVMSRWFLHHHGFQFGPTLRWLYAESSEFVHFQYGYISGVLQGSLTQYFLGSYTIDNYFGFFPVFFILYFLILQIVVYLITRSLTLTALAGFLKLTFLYSTKYEYLTMGPGLVPIRYFFDALVVLALFYFVRSPSLRRLACVALLSVLGLALNFEFGLFMVAAVLFGLASLISVTKWRPRWREFIVLGFSVIAAALIWKISQSGAGAVGLYLKGWWSPLLPQSTLLNVYLSFFMVCIWLARHKLSWPAEFLVPLLASLAHLILKGAYVVWGTGWHHVVSLSDSIVLSSVLLLNLLFHSLQASQLGRFRRKIEMGALLIAAGIFVAAFRNHKTTRIEFQSLIDGMTNKQWSISGAKILTSIPEVYFSDTLELLSKFEAGKNYFLVSKFDSLILMLDQAANELPGSELMTYLLSERESKIALDTVKQKKPALIFADIDIFAPLVDELIDPNTQYIGAYHSESYMRTKRVGRMKKFFLAISAEYELIESKGLLSVWRRKVGP